MQQSLCFAHATEHNTSILGLVLTQGHWLLPPCDCAFLALRILLVQQEEEKRDGMVVVVGFKGQAW